MEDTILEIKHELCICCMTTHDIKKVRFMDRGCLDGKEFEFEVTCWYCEKADEYYEDEEMMGPNAKAYREAIGPIKEIPGGNDGR